MYLASYQVNIHDMDDDSILSDVSSEVSVDPRLSCSFSSFESEGSDTEDRAELHKVVEPYMFEPVASKTSRAESAPEDDDEDSQEEERLHSRDWLVPY